MGGKHWQFVTKNDKLKIPRKDSFGDFFWMFLFFFALVRAQYIFKRLKCIVNTVLCNNIFEVLQKLVILLDTHGTVATANFVG